MVDLNFNTPTLMCSMLLSLWVLAVAKYIGNNPNKAGVFESSFFSDGSSIWFLQWY